MHFLEIFGQKKCLFGSKTVFLGQEVHYYMAYIAYFTELILQICDYAQKRRIWHENCKYAFDENFHCHFCSRRQAAKFCHPVSCSHHTSVLCRWFMLWESVDTAVEDMKQQVRHPIDSLQTAGETSLRLSSACFCPVCEVLGRVPWVWQRGSRWRPFLGWGVHFCYSPSTTEDGGNFINMTIHRLIYTHT